MSKPIKPSPKLPAGWPLLVGVVLVAVLLVVHYFTKPALQRLHSSEAKPAVVGKVLKYEIREDSGSTEVNAIHVKGTYSTDTLEFVGIDAVGSSFAIATEGTGDDGKISIARGTIKSVKGDRLVATLLFKSRGGGAAPAVTIDNGQTVLVATASATNILGKSGTKVYAKEAK